MKKFTLLFVMAFAFITMSAQTYSENFNNGMPSNMRYIDNDGHTAKYPGTWPVGTPWASMKRAAGDSMAISTSYYVPAATSDDWMITPKITPVTGDYLAWEAMAWAASYADGYVVKLSTTDSAMASFTTTLLTVPAEQADWTGHTIDMTPYVGQSVYIAFINNSTDMYVLSIDNIMVMSNQFAAKATSVILPTKIGKNLAPFVISGSMVNQGLTSLTSYELSYSINGGAAVTSTITPTNAVNIYNSDNFSHPTTWTPTATGIYTIKTWIGNLNGSNANLLSDTVTSTVEIIASSVQRNPLFETFTSSTCGPCVNGNKNLKEIFDANPNMWVCVKYQMSWPGDGDSYYTSEGGDRRTYYGVTSVPHQYIDGGFDGNSGSVTKGDLMDAYYNVCYLEMTADMTYSVSGKYVSVNTTMTPAADINGNLKLFVAIVEKKTTGNVGSNGETEFHWVMKKMLPDANGTTLANFTSGNAVSKHNDYAFNGNYRLPNNAKDPIDNATENSVEEFDDLIAVVWVQDVTTKEVIQAVFSSVTVGMDEAERASIITNIYPNPATDNVNIELNNQTNENVEISIMNNLGQVLSSNNYGSLIGTQKVTMDVSNLVKGIYFVKVQIGEKYYVKPIQVN